MSEVKVNKISPRSGTGVQLGDSGDTITVPAGATLTGTQNIATLHSTGSGQITINGQAVAPGGPITLTMKWHINFSSITPSTIENTNYFKSQELIWYQDSLVIRLTALLEQLL